MKDDEQLWKMMKDDEIMKDYAIGWNFERWWKIMNDD